MKFLALFIAVCFASVLPAEETGADRLAKLLFIHSVEMEEVEKPLREQVGILNDNYVKALEREATKAQKAGNLEDLLAIKQEIEHIEEHAGTGAAPYPGHLQMRKKYGEALLSIAKAGSGDRALVAAKHAKELEQLKVELTKEGDLATAVEIDRILKNPGGDAVAPPARTSAPEGFATNVIEDGPLFENEIFYGELDLERGIYEIKDRIRLGSDEPENREDRFGHVVAPPGTVFRGGDFFIDNGSIDAAGCLFDGVDLNVDLGGEVTAEDCIFDGGRMRKGGAWAVRWFSAKWTLGNCILHEVFLSPMRLKANGWKVTDCTVIGATIEPGEYYDEPVEESGHEWRQVERCHFIDCEIPESFLLMTEDCVFESCTFVADIGDVNPERSASVTMYFKRGIPSPPPGDNRVTFKAEDVSRLRKDFGSDLEYEF